MVERRELGEGCAGVVPLPDSCDHWLTRPCRAEFWAWHSRAGRTAAHLAHSTRSCGDRLIPASRSGLVLAYAIGRPRRSSPHPGSPTKSSRSTNPARTAAPHRRGPTCAHGRWSVSNSLTGRVPIRRM